MTRDTNSTSDTAATTYAQLIRSQSDAWQHIMQDSGQLLQLAHQKNWDQLLLLHEKRDVKLQAFFNDTLAQDLVEQVRHDLETIRSQDALIVQLVKNNQSELGAEAKHLKQMKARIKDYISADNHKL